MATAKQIAANRANAKRSTGPKTAAGKARSRRNAFKHGFSVDLEMTPELAARFVDIQRELVDAKANAERKMAAARFAQAQLQLVQIRQTRRDAFARLQADLTRADPYVLRQLRSLDRYERYAITRRRRAMAKLDN
ncbi:MAG: hypothetical protein J0H51_04780 [Rhizobiales bacterium]|nr:hypothetical protein [Hyphomicrobiales bacterium]